MKGEESSEEECEEKAVVMGRSLKGCGGEDEILK